VTRSCGCCTLDSLKSKSGAPQVLKMDSLETLRRAFAYAYTGDAIISEDVMRSILNDLGVSASAFKKCRKTFKKKTNFQPEEVFGILMVHDEKLFSRCLDWSELQRLQRGGQCTELSEQATHQAAQFCGISKCRQCWRYIPYHAAQCCCERNVTKPAARLCVERSSTSNRFSSLWDYVATFSTCSDARTPVSSSAAAGTPLS
jgi:hypothetical protein